MRGNCIMGLDNKNDKSEKYYKNSLKIKKN